MFYLGIALILMKRITEKAEIAIFSEFTPQVLEQLEIVNENTAKNLEQYYRTE